MPLPTVWEDAILFDLLGGGFGLAIPSLIRNFVSSCTTSRDTVSITKFYFKHTACALVKNYIDPLIDWRSVKCVWHTRYAKWLHYSVCLMESMCIRHSLNIYLLLAITHTHTYTHTHTHVCVCTVSMVIIVIDTT